MGICVDKVAEKDEIEKQSLLESIDYGRLSETALQTAFDSKLVPASLIAKASLNLCTKLRSELDAANAVIRIQEAELARRKGRSVGVATTTAWTGRADSTDSGIYFDF